MSPHTLSSTLPFIFIFFLTSAPELNAITFNCDPSDHQTLLKIKAELGNPVALSSWDPTTNCCTWKGLWCDSAGKTLGLTITNADTSSPIPPSLGLLPSLSYLTLRKISGLTGPIPASLSTLPYLKTLTIRQTALSGPIPTDIGRMSQLGLLDLSYNHLSGTIPDIFSAITMQLYSLDLGHNKLTGSIPASMFAGCLSDPILRLARNQLTGPIPPALGKVGFREIDLSRNWLTGDASFLFGAGKTTTLIVLSRNKLEFDMSDVEFPTELATLDVSHNGIWGSIPMSITELKKLQTLDVSFNQLCGRIPSGRFSFVSYVKNKCLCGAPLRRCGKKGV